VRSSHEEPNSSDHCAYFSREATVGLTLPSALRTSSSSTWLGW